MCHPRVGFECSRPCHLSALLCFALPHQIFLNELHVKHCIACFSAIRQQIVFTFVNICVSRNAPPPPFVPGAKLVQDLITFFWHTALVPSAKNLSKLKRLLVPSSIHFLHWHRTSPAAVCLKEMGFNRVTLPATSSSTFCSFS